jgi:hypothetical protein
VRHQNVFRFEIQVHEAALMHVAQAQGHINQNLRDVLRQQRIMPREQLLQVRRLDIIHEQVKRSVLPAMLDIADDVIAFIDFGKDLASPQKPPARQQIKTQLLFQLPQGVRFAAPVGDHPDFRHAAAVEKFLEIKSSELLLRRRRGFHFILQTVSHVH